MRSAILYIRFGRLLKTPPTAANHCPVSTNPINNSTTTTIIPQRCFFDLPFQSNNNKSNPNNRVRFSDKRIVRQVTFGIWF